MKSRKIQSDNKSSKGIVFWFVLSVTAPFLILIFPVFNGFSNIIETNISFTAILFTQICFNIIYFWSRGKGAEKQVKNEAFVELVFENKYELLTMIERKIAEENEISLRLKDILKYDPDSKLAVLHVSLSKTKPNDYFDEFKIIQNVKSSI